MISGSVRALEAHGELGGDAARDVHDGGRRVERAGGVAGAGTGGREDRADQRKTDLAAVGVACQEEVDVVCPGPGELVGAVRQRDAQGAAVGRSGRGVVEIGGGWNPGELVAGQDDRLAAELDLDPTAAQVDEAGVGEGAADSVGVAPEIVVAEDEVDAGAGGQFAQGVGDPVDALGLVDEVAGDGHEVGLELVGKPDDFLEVGLADPAGEVEIGEVEDRDPVERRSQPGDFEGPFGYVHL